MIFGEEYCRMYVINNNTVITILQDTLQTLCRVMMTIVDYYKLVNTILFD